MNPLIAWPVFAMVTVAAAIDIRTREIPNWLTMPFVAGGIIINIFLAGWTGLGQSLEGIALAVLILGGLCLLRTMGLGDLKLCAAAGAWMGPETLLFALVITAMAGGILAIAYATWRGKLGVLFDRASNLSLPSASTGFQQLHAKGLTIPYAPAIAVGVVFSFFSV